MSKELSKFLQDMEKKFGEENSLKEFGEGIANVEVIPTGLPSLDLATGIGGLPRGRVIEIYGPEGAGKTTVALKIMAEAQKLAGQMPRMTYKPKDSKDIKPLSGRVGFLDVEHALTPNLLDIHGVKTGEGSGFYFDQPMGGDEALDKLYMMVESGLFDVIVVDSVAGLTTEDERAQDAGESVMASTARLMSNNLKKLVGMISETRTVVIFINQIREKPAVRFGLPETTPGGRALKFYSSMRIRVSRKETINEGSNNPIGHTMGFNIRKNKMSPPFQTTDIDLYYRDSEIKGKQAGFDIFGDFVTTARAMGIIELRGSSYRYVDKKTGELYKASGLVAFKKLIEETDGLYEQIIDDVMGGYEEDDSEQEK